MAAGLVSSPAAAFSRAAPAAPGGSLAVAVNNDPAVAEAKDFIQDMADRGISFLGDQNLSHEQRTSEFRKLLESSFDMGTIARFALGRYWRTASAAQQKEYLKLFHEMIVRVYSQRFSEYEGQELVVRGGRKDGTQDVIVHSAIVPDNGPEVSVDWRVRNKDGRRRVIDVVVEGVSMAVTQRSDFASVIQRGGGDLEVLIEHLRQQTGSQ